MVTTAIPRSSSEPSSSAFPILMLVQGEETRTLTIDHTPFTIGRKAEKDLVLTDPRVSRDHAVIVSEEGEFFLVDQGSKHGTYVNGERIQRTRLQPDARLEFGARDGVFAVFRPQRAETNVAREFLHQISDIEISAGTGTNDLEKLTLFLEAARKLNTAGVLDEILVTLVETTLRLTGAERGYIFLVDNDTLRLAAGRNAAGLPLPDDKTISHSILEDAVRSASEFLVSDTSQSHELAGRNSIIAYDLRTVICIPLRKMQVQAVRSETPRPEAATDVIGALYLDARYTSRDMSGVGHDLLRAIAREAASLIENARLVQAEEAARRYQQELSIAATIQQRLMSVIIPEVPFATLRARNISCKEVGGDFFDAVKSDTDLSVVISDVSGKGITAALLASTLQGMIYSHLVARLPLAEMVTAVNQFLCKKHIGEKYATLVVVRLHPGGRLEYVNCGHVPPLVVSADARVSRPESSNLPVGLLAEAAYEAGEVQLKAGDRVVLVTDGVTEAENGNGEFFEDQRLQEVAANSNFEGIFTAVSQFCAGTPLADDCTLVELEFLG
jgi:phosphoserine phosphatase RsbU/P